MKSLYEAQADIINDKDCIVHITNLSDGNSILPHYHEGIEILNFFDGEGQVEIDGEIFKVKKGDTVIFNSKQVHFVKSFDNMSYFCVIIKKSFLKKYTFPYKEKYLQNKIKNCDVDNYCRFLNCEKSTDNPWYNEKMNAYLILLSSLLFSSYTDEKRSRVKPAKHNKTELVISVIDFIEENCEKAFNIDEIASVVGYSKYYLCRTFKELTNRTIIEYVNTVKCTKAMEDLKSGEYTVYEIANKYNFENFSYFSGLFKKYTGKSPSFFKKK